MDSENSYSSPLCAYGCGFFGSAETNNLCSKCYKIYLNQQQEEQEQEQCISNLSSLRLTTDNSLTTNKGASGSEKIDDGNPKKKTRCESCNKKVGLTGFKCRCGHVFCGLHRYPEEHSCAFDFKEMDREALVKNNPLVKADKLDSRV